MRRYTFRLTMITLAAALVATLLRYFELRTAFEESGLARPWAPLTIILALFAAAYAVFLFLRVRPLRDRQAPAGYEKAFGYRSGLKLAALILTSLLLFAAAILCFLGARSRDSFGALYVQTEVAALGVLAMVAAVCFLVLAIAAYRQEDRGGLAFCAIVPVLFYCFLLVVLYKNRAADPVIRDYVYELFSICAALLAVFFAAGFACGRPRLKRTVYFSQLGLFFSIITLADGHELWMNGICLFSALWLLLTGYSLGKNLQKTVHPAATADLFPPEAAEEVFSQEDAEPENAEAPAEQAPEETEENE